MTESDSNPFSEGVNVIVESTDDSFPPPEPELPDSSVLFDKEYKDVPEDRSFEFPKIKMSKENKRALEIIYYMIDREEYSLRGLLPSELVLISNTAHYTVWIFRQRILDSTLFSLDEEMEFTRSLSFYNLKAFQVWNHRKWLVLKGYNPKSEMEYTRLEIMVDSKNYILWQYRQWLLKEYLSEDRKIMEDELSLTTTTLQNDPLNNSMWVYRNFVLKVFNAYSIPELDFCVNLPVLDDVVLDYLGHIITNLSRNELEDWANKNNDKETIYELVTNYLSV